MVNEQQWGAYEEKYSGDRTSQADLSKGLEYTTQASKGEEKVWGPDSPYAYKAPDSMLDLLKSAAGFVDTAVDFAGTLDERALEAFNGDMQKFLHDADTGKLEEYNTYDDDGKFVATDWGRVTGEVRNRNKAFKDNTWLLTTEGNLAGEMSRFKTEASSVNQWGGNVKVLWSEKFKDLVTKGYGAKEIADEYDVWVDGFVDDPELQNSLREWKSRMTLEMSTQVEAENFSLFQMDLRELETALLTEIELTGELDGQAIPTFWSESGSMDVDGRNSLASLVISSAGSNTQGSLYDQEYIADRFYAEQPNPVKTSIVGMINKIENVISQKYIEKEGRDLYRNTDNKIQGSSTDPLNHPKHAEIVRGIREYAGYNEDKAVEMLEDWMDNLLHQRGSDVFKNMLSQRDVVGFADSIVGGTTDYEKLSEILHPSLTHIVSMKDEEFESLYQGALGEEIVTTLEWFGMSEDGENNIDTVDSFILARLNEHARGGGKGHGLGNGPSTVNGGGGPGVSSNGVSLRDIQSGKKNATDKDRREATAGMNTREWWSATTYNPALMNNTAITKEMLSTLAMMPGATDAERAYVTGLISSSMVDYGTYNTQQNQDYVRSMMAGLFSVSQEEAANMEEGDIATTIAERNGNFIAFREGYTNSITSRNPNNSWPSGIEDGSAITVVRHTETYMARIKNNENLSDEEQNHFLSMLDFVKRMPEGHSRNLLIRSFSNPDNAEGVMNALKYVNPLEMRAMQSDDRGEEFAAIKRILSITGPQWEEYVKTSSELFNTPLYEQDRAKRAYGDKELARLGPTSILPADVKEFEASFNAPTAASATNWMKSSFGEDGYDQWLSVNGISDSPLVVWDTFREQLPAIALNEFDSMVLGNIVYHAGEEPIEATDVQAAVVEVFDRWLQPHLYISTNGNIGWREGSTTTEDLSTGRSYNLSTVMNTYGLEEQVFNQADAARIQIQNTAIESVDRVHIDKLIDQRTSIFPPSLELEVANTIRMQLPAIMQGYSEGGNLLMQIGDLDSLIEGLYITYEADQDSFPRVLAEWRDSGAITLTKSGGKNARKVDPSKGLLMYNGTLGMSSPGTEWSDGSYRSSRHKGVPSNRTHHGAMVWDEKAGQYKNAQNYVELDPTNITGWSRENGMIPVIHHSGSTVGMSGQGGGQFISYEEEREELYSVPIWMMEHIGAYRDRVSAAYPILNNPDIRSRVMNKLGIDEESFGIYLEELQRNGSVFQEQVPFSPGGSYGEIVMDPLSETSTRQVRPATELQGAISGAILASKRSQEVGRHVQIVEVKNHVGKTLTVDGPMPEWNSVDGWITWAWADSVTDQSEWPWYKDAYHWTVSTFPKGLWDVAGKIASVPGRLNKGFGEFDAQFEKKGLDRYIESGDYGREAVDEMRSDLQYVIPEGQYERANQSVTSGMSAIDVLKEGMSGVDRKKTSFKNLVMNHPWWALPGSLGERMEALNTMTITMNPIGLNDPRTRGNIPIENAIAISEMDPFDFWDASVSVTTDIEELKTMYSNFWGQLSTEEKYGLYIVGIDSKEELFYLHSVYGSPSTIYMPADPRTVDRVPMEQTITSNEESTGKLIHESLTDKARDYFGSLKREPLASGEVVTSTTPEKYSFEHGIMNEVMRDGQISWQEFFNQQVRLAGDKTAADTLFDIPTLKKAYVEAGKAFSENYFYFTARGIDSPDDLFTRQLKAVIVEGTGVPSEFKVGSVSRGLESVISGGDLGRRPEAGVGFLGEEGVISEEDLRLQDIWEHGVRTLPSERRNLRAALDQEVPLPKDTVELSFEESGPGTPSRSQLMISSEREGVRKLLPVLEDALNENQHWVYAEGMKPKTGRGGITRALNDAQSAIDVYSDLLSQEVGNPPKSRYDKAVLKRDAAVSLLNKLSLFTHPIRGYVDNKDNYIGEVDDFVADNLEREIQRLQDYIADPIHNDERGRLKETENVPQPPGFDDSVISPEVSRGTGGILGMVGAAAMGAADTKGSLKETEYKGPEGEKIYENKWGEFVSEDGRMWLTPETVEKRVSTTLRKYEGAMMSIPRKATRTEDFNTVGIGHLLDGSGGSRERFAEAVPKADYDAFRSGEVLKDGKWVKLSGSGLKASITEEEAEALFKLDMKANIKKAKDLTPTWDTLSPNLQIQIVSATFRGSWGYSGDTRKLVTAGEFEKAAVEFLNSTEYRDAVALGRPGIRPRMEAVAEALKLEAERKK